MYVSISEAVVELKNRQQTGMREQVEHWWGQKGWPKPPKAILNGCDNKAVFSRHVPTARYEDLCFWQMATNASLAPTLFNYTVDRFVSVSSFKRSLLQHFVCDGRGRNGNPRTKKITLSNITKHDGRSRLSEIRISNGEKLVAYHENRARAFMPGTLIVDGSPWLAQFGSAQKYYPAFLSLFIAHAVLFEDYHGGESGNKLDDFTIGVFEPAWHQVHENFGIQPLIVKMPWKPEFALYPKIESNWQSHDII